MAEILRVSRDEFLSSRWQYKAGQHVTLLGPNGSGKTHLAYQLLERTARPKLPAVVLAMKPRDPTVRNWTKKLGFETIREWPPMPSFLKPNPPGWTLWPKHVMREPDLTNQRLYSTFRRAILDCYARGNRIVFADELYGLAEELNLERELITVWSRGRSMGCGLWGGTQRPAWVPVWAYDQAEHLFLAYDADARARKRFDEIGGVDPRVVSDAVATLKKFQWLYIRRTGPALCIVDP